MKSPLGLFILFCLLTAAIHFTVAVQVEGKQYALIIADNELEHMFDGSYGLQLDGLSLKFILELWNKYKIGLEVK